MMLSYLILVGDDGTIDPDDQRAADKVCVNAKHSSSRVLANIFTDRREASRLCETRLERHHYEFFFGSPRCLGQTTRELDNG